MRATPPETAPPARAAEAPGIGRMGVIGLVGLVGAFAALRFAALQNDLWMDEIWSIAAVQELKSAGEIFTRYLQANNHPLSSLWLYAIAPVRVEWLYRLLSWITGSASLVLGAMIAVRQFRSSHPDATSSQLRAAAWTAATLFGGCYLLIVYSSEARGYAPALAFSLLAYYVLLRAPLERPAEGWMILYWIACLLALLSHAASVQVIGAAILWSAIRNLRANLPLLKSARLIVAWHGVPILATAAFFLFFLRRIGVGGAPDPSIRQSLGELVAYTFGFPTPYVGWIALPFLIAIAVFTLWRMWRRSPADAAFYGALILSAPVLALVAARLAVLFPRYFIFGCAWSLLLIAYGVAASWTRHRFIRVGCIGLIALCVAGNCVHTCVLLRHGRGEYQAALKYIAAQTTTPDISLCSDHDNRNYMLIAFYAPRAVPGRPLRYITGNGSPNSRPQWLFVHRLDGDARPDTPLYDDRGNTYQLEKVFLHAPLSGWDWFVYRNIVTKQ